MVRPTLILRNVAKSGRPALDVMKTESLMSDFLAKKPEGNNIRNYKDFI